MRENNTSIAVFVMSCDKTSDVARHFVAAFKKYWPDCPYQIFFGINHNRSHLAALGTTPLPSEVKGWRDETLNQLQALRVLAPGIMHVLVFLDDFILSEKVDTQRVRWTLSAAVAQNVAYLRLRRLEEGILGSLKQHFMAPHLLGDECCIEVRLNHPYHSSLQVALWRYDHLYASVERAENIWAFERLINSANPHYSVLNSLLTYRHIVEKGRWDKGAEEYCLKAIGWFQPGNRPSRTLSVSARYMSYFKKIIFKIFGYLPMRLTKKLL